jgi:hypothetical protein
MAASREFLLQWSGYGLTTAEIHYHLPDHPALLQLYVWQDCDMAPDFPRSTVSLTIGSASSRVEVRTGSALCNGRPSLGNVFIQARARLSSSSVALVAMVSAIMTASTGPTTESPTSHVRLAILRVQ